MIGRIAWAVACISLLATSLEAQQAVAIRGTDVVVLEPPPGVVVSAYSNLGYRMSKEGDRVRIEVSTSPIESHAAFHAPTEGRDAPATVAALARRLTASETTVYGAASRILDWVARNIAYRLDRSLPQDSATVLSRRSGYCTGIARLTVRLLQAVGIEAREVPGYVVASPEDPGGISGYHRWVEIHYPDRGWAFSDPISSHHYVPATYLRLASEQLDPLWAGSEARIVSRQRHLLPIDVYPSRSGITARRNDDVQLAGAVLVDTPASDRDAEVILSHGELRQSCTPRNERCVFVGLPAGRFKIVMQREDAQLYSGTLRVNLRQRVRVKIPGTRVGTGSR